MDPLSITANVVGLTAKCVQTAKALNDLREKYKHANMTITAICTESTIISASLSNIQNSMLSSPDALSAKLESRPDLESTLDSALTGCFVVFDVLEAEVLRLTGRAVSESTEFSFKTKAQYLWNEKSMQEILGQIRGLQTALTLLLQVLERYSITDLYQLADRVGNVPFNLMLSMSS